ncbi:MAG: hypothetical protein Q9159_004556 [Coniocarpon cinnabarinum]
MLNALYSESKTKISICHLEPHEMIWFIECLKHPTSTYYTHDELLQRTAQLITALPGNLRNPFGGTRLSQSALTRFCKKIGASSDTLPQASKLCRKHGALSGLLTSSLRNYLEYVAEDLSIDVTDPIGLMTLKKSACSQTLTLLRHAENVMALILDGEEFYKTYRRQAPWYFKPTQCDACFSERVLQSTDTICGLRGVALRAQQAGIMDDLGRDRSNIAKILLEACIATWSKEDALLMFSISDKMADDLGRLAEKTKARVRGRRHQQDDTNPTAATLPPSSSRTPKMKMNRGASASVVSYSNDMVPPPLNIRRPSIRNPPSNHTSAISPENTGRRGPQEEPASAFSNEDWSLEYLTSLASPRLGSFRKVEMEHGHRAVLPGSNTVSSSAPRRHDTAANAAASSSLHTSSNIRRKPAPLSRSASQPSAQAQSTSARSKTLNRPDSSRRPKRSFAQYLATSSVARGSSGSCFVEADYATGCWDRAYANGKVPFPLERGEVTGGWI